MTDAQTKRFKKYISNLNSLIAEIREIEPEAQFYLENGHNFYILSGESHEGFEAHARQDRIIAHAQLDFADCGGW